MNAAQKAMLAVSLIVVGYVIALLDWTTSSPVFWMGNVVAWVGWFVLTRVACQVFFGWLDNRDAR